MYLSRGCIRVAKVRDMQAVSCRRLSTATGVPLPVSATLSRQSVVGLHAERRGDEVDARNALRGKQVVDAPVGLWGVGECETLRFPVGRDGCVGFLAGYAYESHIRSLGQSTVVGFLDLGQFALTVGTPGVEKYYHSGVALHVGGADSLTRAEGDAEFRHRVAGFK